MPENRGETKILIHEFQWEAFWKYIEEFASITNNHKVKNFILNYLQPHGFNDLWIEVFRNEMSNALGLEAQGIIIIPLSELSCHVNF